MYYYIDHNMSWIVMNIGCIECGVSSNLVAVMDSEEAADKLADHLSGTASWRHGGENHFEVYEMTKTNFINPQYKEYLEDFITKSDLTSQD